MDKSRSNSCGPDASLMGPKQSYGTGPWLCHACPLTLIIQSTRSAFCLTRVSSSSFPAFNVFSSAVHTSLAGIFPFTKISRSHGRKTSRQGSDEDILRGKTTFYFGHAHSSVTRSFGTTSLMPLPIESCLLPN